MSPVPLRRYIAVEQTNKEREELPSDVARKSGTSRGSKYLPCSNVSDHDAEEHSSRIC